MRTPDGKSIRDMVAADANPSAPSAPAAPAPEPSGGRAGRAVEPSGSGAQPTTQMQPQATAGAPDAGGKREYFIEIDGKRIKADVGEDGKIASKDIEAMLRDPRDYYKRHFSSVADRNVKVEREKIRREELANVGTEIAELKKMFAEFRTGLGSQNQTTKAPDAGQSKAAERVDWSRVDTTDHAQVLSAMQQEADYRAEQKAQGILERMQQADRYKAEKTLREAHSAWKGYDQEIFLKILSDAGVTFTEQGPDYSKTPPHVLQDIAAESLKTLSDIQTTEERIGKSIDRAISLMPVEFDAHLRDRVDDEFRAEMKKGAPYKTDKDCEFIAYEVAKRVMENDNKRLTERAAAIRKAFESNKGASATVATDKPAPTVDNSSDLGKLSSEERHRLIRERGSRDRTL